MEYETQLALLKLFVTVEINNPSGATSGFSMVFLSGTLTYSTGNILMEPGGRHGSSNP